ncbi:UNVERIFIED_ORG: hypothetical protein ABIC43_002653 [Variovorax guangxiensis]
MAGEDHGGGTPAPSSRVEKVTKWASGASALIAVLAAALGLYWQYKAEDSKKAAEDAQHRAAASAQANEAQRIDFERKRVDNSLEETRFKRDQYVYEKVVEVLQMDEKAPGRHRREQAAFALINSVASEDLAGRLFPLVALSFADPVLRAEAGKAGEFAQEQKAIEVNRSAAAAVAKPPASSSSGKFAGFRVDILYCTSERDPEVRKRNEAPARDLLARLKAARGDVTWRLREFPEASNAVPGYLIRGVQVRYNPRDNETEAAQALRQMVVENVPKDFDEVTLREVSQRTPSYLSLFICRQETTG